MKNMQRFYISALIKIPGSHLTFSTAPSLLILAIRPDLPNLTTEGAFRAQNLIDCPNSKSTRNEQFS